MSSEFGLCSWTLGSEDPNETMKQIAKLGLDGLQFHGDHRTHHAAAHHDALASAGFRGPIMLEFCIATALPHTPPSSSGDRQNFAKQCHDSLDSWRSFAQHCDR